MTLVGDILVETDDRLGDNAEPEILTLTEKNGFVPQFQRFKKRLATAETSDYKLVRRNELAYNPYLLWAGALALNTICDVGIVSPAYPTFRVRENYDPRFIGRLLLSERMIKAYDTIAFGAVPRRRRTSVADFLSLPLGVLPSRKIQERVAELLDRADVLRRLRRKSLALLDELTTATFMAMFGDANKRYAMSTVADLAADGPNAIRTGPFGSQLLHSEFVPEGIAVLGIDSVVENAFRWREGRAITPKKYGALKRYTVRPGDVLITIMGTCGRCAIVPDGIPPAISTKHLCCISLDHSLCLPGFLRAYFLTHPVARQHLARETQGAIMSGLNMTIIKRLPVPLVPLELQEKYVAADAQIAANRTRTLSASDLLDELLSSLEDRALREAA